jgi:hypothetical protein
MRHLYLHLDAIFLLLLGVLAYLCYSSLRCDSTHETTQFQRSQSRKSTLAKAQPSTYPAQPQSPKLCVSPTATELASSPLSQSPVAVQLAENVALPAAVLALADPTHNSPLSANDRRIAEEITNAFYQELSNSAVVTANRTRTDTIIITPGPAVDQARRHADERFQALFGDSDYMKSLTESAIEVRIPLSGK